MYDVSVIIPNLNSVIIDKVVNSILTQSTELTFEIIIVGQDKPGLIPENVRVKKINTQNVIPPGIARNIGVEVSSGVLLLFVDADCIASSDLLDTHWEAHFSEGMQYAARVVCGSVLFPERGYLQLCDNVATFHEYMPHLREESRRVLPTLNFSIKKSNWYSLGGFYPYAAGEDADLVNRAIKSGMQAIFTPRPKVLHQHNRKDIKDIMIHAWRLGKYSLLFTGLYDRIGSSLFRLLFILGSPLVAFAIIVKILIKSKLPIRYWHTLPIVYLVKLVWCLGMAFRDD